MKKNNLNRNILIITLSIIVVLVLNSNLHFMNFAIQESDWILDGTVTPLLFEIGNFSNTTNKTTVILSIFEGVNYTLEAPTAFFTIGNSTAITTNLPDPEGTNLINRYLLSVVEGTNINIDKSHVLHTKTTIFQNVTQNVSVPEYLNGTVSSAQICAAVGGTYLNVTCTCPTGVKWYDNSTTASKVCLGATVEKKVEVKVLPTFFEKYWLAITEGIVLGGFIIFLLNRRKK